LAINGGFSDSSQIERRRRDGVFGRAGAAVHPTHDRQMLRKAGEAEELKWIVVEFTLYILNRGDQLQVLAV